MDTLNWNSEIWNIIDSYFKSNKNYLSKTQLDSYNIFLSQQIPKTIRQFNPIKLFYCPYSSEDSDNTIYKFEAEFIIGGSCRDEELNEESLIINDAKSVYITKPIIQQKIVEDGVSSIVEKQLYPNEARLKNLTYKSDITCDVFLILKSYLINGDLEKRVVKKFENIGIGSVPIMLHSNSCVLNNMTKNTLFMMGECIYDEGGYFIIDGKEKVVVAQERQVENKLYIKKNSNQEDRYNCELEIRSVPELIFQPARIIRLYLLNEKYSKNEIIEKNIIRVAIPNIEDEIPLFIVFRALGVISDKDILNLIINDIDTKLGKVMFDLLRPSIIESQIINSQVLAIDFLKEKVTAYGKKLPMIKGKTFNIKDAFLLDILKNYFLPHVGKDFISKSIFLGYMVRELILTKLNIKPETDRDSFINKRVDASGFLIGNIFRDLYFRIKNELEQNLNKFYYDTNKTKQGSTDNFWKSDSENDKNHPFFNIVGEEENNNIIPMKKLLNRRLMDEGFMYTFKNCWGLKDSSSKCKEGVVQDLNRLNYLGYVSHIRRVNMNLSKSAKVRAPHSLHASSYGIMCPNETPDGGNVGLRKNMAIMAKVTFGINSQSLYKVLLKNNLISIFNFNQSKKKSICAVFLNEILVGYHRNPDIFVYKLKLLRRNALINIYTSIAWYASDNIIKISTDSGRCCRPLLIVDNNKLLLNKKHIEDITAKNINWNHLIGGFKTLETEEKPFYDYNDKYIELENESIEFLEKNSGVIEYIDTEEANTILVAVTPNDLDEENNKINKYTHCEIHPSMMWGVLPNNIPLVECNQAPRNQFATAQGKQSLGIYTTNFKNRMDTKGQIMYYPQKPIIQSKMSKYLNSNDLPHGINAIVAIGCFSGYNQEDSIIFNKDSVQRGLFKTTKFKTYSGREELIEGTSEREIFTIPNPNVTRNIKNGNYSHLDPETGLIKENIKVNENDIIIGKVVTTNQKDNLGRKIFIDNSEFVKRNEDGFIDRVYFNYGNDEQKYAKIRIRKDKQPEVGDKFASRYGQKGTIGMLLDARDMPVTKDGIVPDLIVNPHAIPSRMTIGQLIEVILGKFSCNMANTMELTGFTNVDKNLVGDLLESNFNYEKQANEVLYNGRNGKQLKANIFIGPTFYQRLTHQVSDKYYSRNEGGQASLTHQPVGGRAAGGGLRIGEMERDAILAHGTSIFLKETMVERSDKYKFYISDKSGLLAIVNHDKKIYEDYSNDGTEIKIDINGNIKKQSTHISDSNFYCIQAPYAFKLFLQEIQSMGIAPRLVVEESVKKWKHIEDITYQELQALKTQDFALKEYYQTYGKKLNTNLLTFEDEIRNILYEGSGKKFNTASILDLSVNRGLDLLYLYKSNYIYVLGIDKNKENIEDDTDNLSANTYLKNLKKSSNDSINQWANNSDINFITGNITKNIRFSEDIDPEYSEKLTDLFMSKKLNSFNTVTLFNDIQNHFNSYENIQNIFENVKDNIKLNGYFIVTCLDGDLIYSLLKENNDKSTLPVKGKIFDSYENEYRDIWKINVSDSGTNLSWENLPDDIENGFNIPYAINFNPVTEIKNEYLVSKKLLINIASKYGLQIISTGEAKHNFSFIQSGTGLFKDIYTSRFEHTKRSNSKKDDLIYDLSNKDNQDLKQLSDMYRYYIFKYQDDTISEHEFLDRQDCRKFVETNQKNKINPRYIAYNQLILTAGDISQIQQYIVEKRALHGSSNFVNENTKSIRNLYNNGTDILADKIFTKNQDLLELSIYKNINDRSFSNTFKYMFQNMKTGIFVKIKNGILTMFTPFFNKKYINDLSDGDLRFIDVTVDKSIYPNGIQDYYAKKNQIVHKKKSIQNIENPVHWWQDNCVINLFGELDDMYTTNFGELKHMLEILCSERGQNLSDVEFFINKQKFPYLRKPNSDGDIMQPHFHIFGKDDIKLTTNNYSSYLPILSMISSDEYADVLIPTSNDWNIVNNKILPPDCYENKDSGLDKLWDDKQTMAFFIGPSTGCGSNTSNNQRLKLAQLYKSWKSSETNRNLLSVRITKWDNQDKVYMGNYLNFTEMDDFTKEFMLNDGYGGINDYKYLIYVDSFSADFNFTNLLALSKNSSMTNFYGNVIFKVKSIDLGLENNYNYKLWYFDMLVPLDADKTNIEEAHYIEVNSDFSNLKDMIIWCNENQDAAKRIAMNAHNFYLKYINKQSMLDYLETTFNLISKNIENNSVIENVFREIIREPMIREILNFPNEKVRYLIGAKGKNIERIKRISDCKIRVDTSHIIPGTDNWEGNDIIKIIIDGKESGIDEAKKEINKIAYQIEKIYVVNTSDLGKLFGKKGRHINAIKKTFSVTINTNMGDETDFEKKWVIRGAEKNIACAIKAFDSLKDTGILSDALEVCISTDIGEQTIEHQEIKPLEMSKKVSPESIYSKHFLKSSSSETQTFGIIVPITDTVEEDYKYAESINLGDEVVKLGGGNNILEKSISNITQLDKLLNEHKTQLESASSKKYNYKIFTIWEKNTIIKSSDLNNNISPEIIKETNKGDNLLKSNLGATINSGIDIAINNNCDYLIIHDVNLLPNKEIIPEYFLYPENPTNISSVNQEYAITDIETMPKNNIKLGIFKINKLDYVKSGGFPNDMWGWGYQNYAFLKRLDYHSIKTTDIDNPGNDYKITDTSINNIYDNDSLINTFGKKQMQYFMDLYLSEYKNGIKQSYWYDIIQNYSINENINIYHIDLSEYQILPMINKSLEEFVELFETNSKLVKLNIWKSENPTLNPIMSYSWAEEFIENMKKYDDDILEVRAQTLITDEKYPITVNKFILIILVQYIKDIFNYSVIINDDNNKLIIDLGKILNLENNSENLLDNFVDKMQFIYRYIRQKTIYLINQELLQLQDNKGNIIEKELMLKSFAIEDTLSENMYEINIVYKIEKEDYFNVTHTTSNQFLTFKNNIIYTIPKDKIDLHREYVASLKSELDEKYADLMSDKSISDSLLFETLGLYGIYYSVDNDTLYIKNIIENIIISTIPDEIKTYNIFLNTLYYNIRENHTKKHILYDELFSISHKLGNSPAIVSINQPSSPLVGGFNKNDTVTIDTDIVTMDNDSIDVNKIDTITIDNDTVTIDNDKVTIDDDAVNVNNSEDTVTIDDDAVNVNNDDDTVTIDNDAIDVNKIDTVTIDNNAVNVNNDETVTLDNNAIDVNNDAVNVNKIDTFTIDDDVVNVNNDEIVTIDNNTASIDTKNVAETVTIDNDKNVDNNNTISIDAKNVDETVSIDNDKNVNNNNTVVINSNDRVTIDDNNSDKSNKQSDVTKNTIKKIIIKDNKSNEIIDLEK